jgi:hypothetical protein
MMDKFNALYFMLQKLALANPEVAIGVGVVFLILLIKKTKFVLSLGFLAALGLAVWFWFTSSFEKRNENQKFKRYKEERIRPAADDEVHDSDTKKN